jgi:Mn-dependent DtxR family transcriptional regulator
MTAENTNLSSSLEDYLEAIFNLAKESNIARSKDIAKYRGIAGIKGKGPG